MNLTPAFKSSSSHLFFAAILSKIPINRYDKNTAYAAPFTPKLNICGFESKDNEPAKKIRLRTAKIAPNLKKPIPVITFP